MATQSVKVRVRAKVTVMAKARAKGLAQVKARARERARERVEQEKGKVGAAGCVVGRRSALHAAARQNVWLRCAQTGLPEQSDCSNPC
jgi:hypothetical protein